MRSRMRATLRQARSRLKPPLRSRSVSKMVPPELAMSSGAERIPFWCRRSPCRSSASWLLAVGDADAAAFLKIPHRAFLVAHGDLGVGIHPDVQDVEPQEPVRQGDAVAARRHLGLGRR
jgi:hypothetical protein